MEPAVIPNTPIIPDEMAQVKRHHKRNLIIIAILVCITTVLAVLATIQRHDRLALTPVPTPTPLPITPADMITASWPAFTIAPLELSLKLPPVLATVNPLTMTEASGINGKQVCWTGWLLEAFKSNTFGECSTMPFTLHTSTADYQTRQVNSFFANRGYTLENDTYFLIRSDGTLVQLDPAWVTRHQNDNQVDMIIITGKSASNGQPLAGNPGEGYVSAVINLANQQYPALTITMKVDSYNSAEMFQAILDNLNTAARKISTPLPINDDGTSPTEPDPQNPGATPTPASLNRSTISSCVVAGCSSHLCVDASQADIITTCEFKWEYQCYRSATCEVQTNGQCGWTMTPELQTCLSNVL
jgi:hypothetical protein